MALLVWIRSPELLFGTSNLLSRDEDFEIFPFFSSFPSLLLSLLVLSNSVSESDDPPESDPEPE